MPELWWRATGTALLVGKFSAGDRGGRGGPLWTPDRARSRFCFGSVPRLEGQDRADRRPGETAASPSETNSRSGSVGRLGRWVFRHAPAEKQGIALDGTPPFGRTTSGFKAARQLILQPERFLAFLVNRRGNLTPRNKGSQRVSAPIGVESARRSTLRAGVTDGQHVWFVREGDPLPGGTAVGAIAGRPPGVRVTAPGKNGEVSLLPYRARPGDGP